MGSKTCSGLPQPHVFLVSYPGQGHLNPLLRLGKLLASRGLLVTLSAPEIVGAQIRKANNNISDQPTPVGDHGLIRFEFYDAEKQAVGQDSSEFNAYLELIGRQKLPQMLKKNQEKGRPVSCLIYNSFIPWVGDVAEALDIPCAALWVQSCASFSAYYHYYHNLVPFPTEAEPKIDVELQSMPLLKYDEVPSFLHPSTQYAFLREVILGQFKNLSKNMCILMETFQELENDVINYMSNICPAAIKPIGPLFSNPRIPTSSNSVNVDIIKVDNSIIEWLNSKPNSSVVYVSFGSVVHLKQEQITEIAYGLLNSGVPFLWVMKPPVEDLEPGRTAHVLPDDFLELAGDKGKIVRWSPQQEVLAHPSVACFMSHCGWNSTLEAIACGVPVLAFPQWGDQVTDAKYLVDEFKVGIRMCRGGESENKIVTKEEVEKCLREATIGPKAAEIKDNALKWKKKAVEAVAEDGSSDRNMQTFLDQLATWRSKAKP